MMEMEDEESAAQRVARISEGLAPPPLAQAMNRVDPNSHLQVEMRPSASPSDMNAINVSIPLSQPNVSAAGFCFALSELETQTVQMSAPEMSQRGLARDLWNRRVQEPDAESKEPFSDNYIRRLFAENAVPDRPEHILFSASPIPSIDSISWALVIARCNEHPREKVGLRLREMAYLLTGEQWFDLWMDEKGKGTAFMLVFGTAIVPWYFPSIVEAAKPMVIDEEVLKQGGARMACHLLGACLHAGNRV